MQRFTNRRSIVTGAGSGIGRATVLRLLSEGGRVAAFDVVQSGLDELYIEATRAGFAESLTTGILDISQEQAVRREVPRAIEAMGGLEVLVNAAGVQRCAHTHEHTLEDWNWTLAINLTGTFLMSREALPALCSSGSGVVVNFSSTSAQFAHPYMAAYAASKGGIQAFTHGLALEYAAQGLRAVNIQPGGISTGMAGRTMDLMPEGYDLSLWAKQRPLLNAGGLADPAAVAAVVAMVASTDGAAVTGTEIRVDGGAHA
jgi:NAD(P)-dependent dehydrogenase (short-subunit alcohol dehydrogenase family)